MSSKRVPTRPAPSVDEARRKQKSNPNQRTKKKAPPRPPTPDLSKSKSKSAWNLNQQPDTPCLFEWSPPSSPKSTARNFGGSISSSFSSSTSSLASSKKSFEYDSSFNVTPWNTTNNSQTTTQWNQTPPPPQVNPVVPQISVPTIIRPLRKKCNVSQRNQVPNLTLLCLSTSMSSSSSPPMPSIPPPSPPKDVGEAEVVPFAIALYNFVGTQSGDLTLQENDVILLIKRINPEWLYGRIGDREGMFPANYVDVRVPLREKYVKALYEFRAQMPGDLELKPDRIVKVLHKITDDWLMGEFEGKQGQFPANFVMEL